MTTFEFTITFSDIQARIIYEQENIMNASKSCYLQFKHIVTKYAPLFVTTFVTLCNLN